MSSNDGFFGLFKSNKQKEKEMEERQSKNQGYIDHFLSEENLMQTLNVVDKVIDSEDWIFAPWDSGGQYENERLEKAIARAKEARQIRDYMENGDVYQGIEINQDVLKTALTHFLNTISHALFYAFRGDAHGLYNKVGETPNEVLKYFIEERQQKLDDLFVNPDPYVDQELANRIFEYDLLLHRLEDPEEEDVDLLEEYCSRFSTRIQHEYLPSQSSPEFEEEEEEDGFDDLNEFDE